MQQKAIHWLSFACVPLVAACSAEAQGNTGLEGIIQIDCQLVVDVEAGRSFEFDDETAPTLTMTTQLGKREADPEDPAYSFSPIIGFEASNELELPVLEFESGQANYHKTGKLTTVTMVLGQSNGETIRFRGYKIQEEGRGTISSFPNGEPFNYKDLHILSCQFDPASSSQQMAS